jgi:FSR family fosmidomycin resistance protein-like MFS transporter
VREAAWPLVRDELDLSYAEIGVLLAAPAYAGALLEVAVGVLADSGRRRTLVVGGGFAFAAGLATAAGAWAFLPLLAAFSLLSPASGAFVSLSQATLMDLDPGVRERNMARWTLAGSVGVVAGPLVLAGAIAVGAGWREVFAALAGAALLVAWIVRGVSFPPAAPGAGVRPALRGALQALRRREVIRWLAILELADLMLGVLVAFLALYLVDVVGLTPASAAVAVGVWTASGLAGDALLLPVLARVDGLRYLRACVPVVAAVYPAFLLAPGLWPKLVLLALLGVLNAGWYAIPKARLYAELHGRSGAAIALGNVAGLAGGAVPLAVGVLAEAAGLATAMWALLLGPLALLVLLHSSRVQGSDTRTMALAAASRGLTPPGGRNG